MDLVRRLKDLQGDKTQTEFANELGVSQSNLSRIYSGDRSIGVDVARKIRMRFPELALEVASFLLYADIPERDTAMPKEDVHQTR